MRVTSPMRTLSHLAVGGGDGLNVPVTTVRWCRRVSQNVSVRGVCNQSINQSITSTPKPHSGVTVDSMMDVIWKRRRCNIDLIEFTENTLGGRDDIESTTMMMTSSVVMKSHVDDDMFDKGWNGMWRCSRVVIEVAAAMEERTSVCL